MLSTLTKIKSLNEKNKSLLIDAKNNNEKRNKYLALADKAKSNFHLSKSYVNLLKNILLSAKKQDNDYKLRRKAYIEDMIKSNLDFIFPQENIEVSLKIETERNKQKIKLKLKEEKDTAFRNPKNSSGGLAQQLISFSSSMGIINLLGKHKFFIDEAFGNGDPENKEKLSKLLESYSKDNQIFMISQGDELYKNIPHREIKLEKINNKVKCISIKDYGGVEDDNKY